MRTGSTTEADVRGVSYEIFGFMNNDGATTSQTYYYGQSLTTGGIKKSERTVDGYTHKNDTLRAQRSAHQRLANLAHLRRRP